MTSGSEVRSRKSVPERRLDTAAWRRIERAIGNLILFAAFALLLAGLSLALKLTGVRAELVKDGSGVQTVAQVVPATVVAIFVFALGAVFVIAQIVVPSRGSRTTTVLLQDWRLRIVLVFGLALLAGALLLSGRSGDGNGAWRSDLAAGLVAATVVYVPCTTILFALSLKNFATPNPYKDLLLRRPLFLGLVPRRRPSPYDFYWRLRVLRGWMRTVSNTAESRDLLFALQGVVELVDQYCCAAARDRAPPIHDDPPDEYRQAQKSPIGQADRDRRGETNADGKGWFAYELGRALARAIETGARGNTLRRDLDRLLDAFVVSIEKMAMKHPCGGQQRLIEDAGILVSHLTEVGLGVRQSDPAQHDWYRAPALRLAELHSYLDEVASYRREEEVAAVRNQALAGWLAVTAALRSDDPPAREAWEEFIKQCVSKLGAHKDWDRATELACEESFRPHWDIATQADTTAIRNLVVEACKP